MNPTGTIRLFLAVLLPLAAVPGLSIAADSSPPTDDRPNILFCIADDWGWPHAGAYGDPVIKTPTFDRLAREGLLFDHAYVSAPSCTPSRGSILTGQHFWRLGPGANLYGTLDVNLPVYPLLLEQAGYHVGHWRKCWGPGNLAAGGYTGGRYPGGKAYKGFKAFLDARPPGKPFCFWLGSSDPHRPYKKGSGARAGMNLDKIPVPAFLPNVPEVRSDIADYYYEVQRFDSDCAQAIALLEEAGLLDNTIIVMTGDNGIPFPRCKANLYDMGVHIPLAIRWGRVIKPGRRVTDFVGLIDLAPTFLEAAGVKVPPQMTGRSLMPLFKSDKSGRIDPRRGAITFGRERHVPAQKFPSMAGYPARAIRTDRYLYIRNYAPDRWPVGAPEGGTFRIKHFPDCDDGPTKAYLLEHRDDPAVRPLFDLCFGKRPAEELYDLDRDPDQLHNRAGDPALADIRRQLADRLHAVLQRTGDPRATGGPVRFDQYPYYSGNYDQRVQQYLKEHPDEKRP